VSTVRVHGFNPVRDLLHIQQDAPAWQMDSILKTIAASERGVLVWIGQPVLEDLGRALAKVGKQDHSPSSKALSQQYRTIGVGAQILRDVGVQQMRLLSSPLRFNALSGCDLDVVVYLAPEQA
jgi:3,4-dihydroxy 2-butanone 4-phosphate synthase/GTP cyclohydrolase II